MLGSGLIREGNPLGVHFVMFLPVLIGQGTVEQQAEWISRAWTCSIIGTYAQVRPILTNENSNTKWLQICRLNSAMEHSFVA
jgi:hypothetical protein